MISYDFEIHRVKSNKDIHRFINLPCQIYKDDPHWMPPLLRDVKFKLNRSKHPFFEHAKMELFLASRGTKPIGRIAAIVDDHNNKFHNE